GVQLYLQTKDEVRVKNYGSDASATSYKAVRASAFNTSSLAEYKTNIEPLEKSALDIISQSIIYSYNLKSDIETAEIGLVIGEGYSIAQEVVNGDGVSQYRMNSLSWKAIQELHEKIKDLKNELAVFKTL
ncbi:tail fiber domain-containing protein, partial [Enterococcus thailandicus]